LNRKGTTVIELMIYIALLSIIFLLVGKQFKGLVNNYVSGRRITRQMTDSRDIIGLMAQEIKNTGLKQYYSAGAIQICDSIYWAPVIGGSVTYLDSSSFKADAGNPGDEISFLKLHLNSKGEREDINSFNRIKYSLDGTDLVREFWHVRGSAHASEKVRTVIAENVYALQFSFGVRGDNTTVTSGISTPGTYTNLTTGSITYTQSHTLVKNEKYTATLNLKYTGTLSSLAITFKNTDDTPMGTEVFLPYSGDFKIEVPATASGQATVDLDYTFDGTGSITLSKFLLTRTQLSDYFWKSSFTDDASGGAQKSKVQAIRIHLLTRAEKKAGNSLSGTINVGGTEDEEPDGAVAVENCSGEYTWRLYTETIPIPNNGR
jgi:hypothetical protein